MLSHAPLLLALTGLLADPSIDRRPDHVVADFEGATYGEGWGVTGSAFGAGPAEGTLPGQMKVDGFEGRGAGELVSRGR